MSTIYHSFRKTCTKWRPIFWVRDQSLPCRSVSSHQGFIVRLQADAVGNTNPRSMLWLECCITVLRLPQVRLQQVTTRQCIIRCLTALVTFIGKPTLGEEYCDVSPVGVDGLPQSGARRWLSMALHVGAPFAYQKMRRSARQLPAHIYTGKARTVDIRFIVSADRRRPLQYDCHCRLAAYCGYRV